MSYRVSIKRKRNIETKTCKDESNISRDIDATKRSKYDEEKCSTGYLPSNSQDTWRSS